MIVDTRACILIDIWVGGGRLRRSVVLETECFKDDLNK